MRKVCFKGALLGLRQFVATVSTLKMMKMPLISPKNLFLFLRFLNFCLDFLVMQKNDLIRKVYFKIYDVKAWETSCNTNIVQYLKK